MIQDQTNFHRHLPLQGVGQPALVQDMWGKKMEWNCGMCLDMLFDRSYVLEVEGQLRRNRKLLKPSCNMPPVATTAYEHGQDEISETKGTSEILEPDTEDQYQAATLVLPGMSRGETKVPESLKVHDQRREPQIEDRLGPQDAAASTPAIKKGPDEW